ncbi:molybdopterin-synthase adenylyltransferase [Photobacterium aquae]|uniref:Molybdopterin-synthase adenylyltransferase n=1 Tax=Photobacterium aquae TaxID=1195763 RepID=A0A0J1JYK8_9GAMM|nr:HesA/MoeB/ThiF family protein [Photobacterium aquae]KLV07337.1 molybdopterin-synthase adenylyltransferase [Photobacterium aquae]
MLDDQVFVRYSRQIMLPEIGEVGQEAIGQARVLLVGAGGLGSAAALYLAGAGVGTIVIADDDVLEGSNLQRQVLYRQHDEGLNKAGQAAAQLRSLNPHIRIRPVNARLLGERLALEVAQADVVLDCSDNLPTRYAVNHACYQAGKPLVSGAAIRWQGQLMVFGFHNGQGPCYHCLFPEPEANEPGGCSQNGIAGPVVGIIGTMQALEALKIICGAGSVGLGCLRQFDGLTMQWHTFRISHDISCPVCGQGE